MKRLLVIAFILVLPTVSFAQEQVAVPDSDPTPKSFSVNDLFHALAHACNIPSSTCGPNNVVTNPFGALIRVFFPTGQGYTNHWIVTDIEGNVVSIASFGPDFRPSGFTTFFISGFNIPGSSNVATRGLYKFISVIIGNDGQIAFSDYYRFRVLP